MDILEPWFWQAFPARSERRGNPENPAPRQTLRLPGEHLSDQVIDQKVLRVPSRSAPALSGDFLLPSYPELEPWLAEARPL